MSDSEKIALGVLFFIAGPMLLFHALDFFVPGRWEKRAYERSMRDFEREQKRKARKP